MKWIMALVVAGLWLSGCGKSQVDRALDPDANGFVCSSCKEKFYTDRKVFASRCPACQKQTVERVMGYQCPDDKHVTYASRSRGSVACEQCQKRTDALVFPMKADLEAWGAKHKASAEVGGYSN